MDHPLAKLARSPLRTNEKQREAERLCALHAHAFL
jgi:hypothetical protein